MAVMTRARGNLRGSDRVRTPSGEIVILRRPMSEAIRQTARRPATTAASSQTGMSSAW